MTMSVCELEPFGLEVTLPEGSEFEALEVAQLEAWLDAHRVVVIRGLRSMLKPELPKAARRLGPLQAWSFGSVHELAVDPGAENYLYTRREVPLHWDGAFAGRVPHHLVFHCLEAPGADAGGATTFVDTAAIWAAADAATRDRWRALRFTYSTERVAHYGGAFTQALVAQHPHTGETVLRYAEPVDDLNPVRVDAVGLSPLESAAMVTELRGALAMDGATYEHQWRAGDVVLADNHALLHGRRAFERDAPRHIRRVNVHDRGRTFVDTLRDSVRIRRPEFMVAEIPILLIAALLATGSFEPLASARFGLLTAMFFLLFHFGDMINCLADRDLDAVYKTPLSEAVYGLGVSNVRAQITLTALGALGLGAWLAHLTQRPLVLGLVALGLALGAQYSTRPLWLKGRGLLQIVTLFLVIFVGPMTLVAVTIAPTLEPRWLALFAFYGAMQEGIILVNTAEDLPEDRAAEIRTSAVVLGLRGSVFVALLLVSGGGLGLMAALHGAGARWALTPMLLAWVFVVGELALLCRDVASTGEGSAQLRSLRSRARRVPIWITLTAWGTLASVSLGTATP